MAFAAGALADNTNFLRFHAFLHVLKGQFVNPVRSLSETTGSQKYAAK